MSRKIITLTILLITLLVVPLFGLFHQCGTNFQEDSQELGHTFLETNVWVLD